jgi:hypothetical protein
LGLASIGKNSQAFPEVDGILFQLFDHLYMLQVGFIVAGPDISGILDFKMLVVSPLKFVIQGSTFEASNLLDVLVSPLLKAKKVHEQDNVDVGDCTSHFSNSLNTIRSL